ncbi:MAG: hydrogenase iron-sulfur subunit [Desulfarculaceae bacterium]|nr:hydrogenase iron-sulfur subunit [Desulfarculaceae bacterium]MCF8073129.1 hydrogenase iron-sulfur subunit [Desulfarculaceae bacterium]MCF8101786.1 hydrogenase iron-sulfur subunit [Desulfarculaceae bacterium]MCF8117350.1 hydrogenase iron-sulfur subunit [Desulfarculaceae bacterium]
MAGNLFARRRFAVMKSLLEYVGIEPGRLHFSWISSAEATKFQETVVEVTESVKALGPAKHMIKDIRKVA